MFKKYRRVLIQYGLNGNIGLFEHFCENLFFMALMVGKSIVWSNQNWDWFTYQGPIMCFLFVCITESINLFNWKKLLDEDMDKEVHSNVESTNDQKKSIESGVGGNHEGGRDLSQNGGTEDEESLDNIAEEDNDHLQVELWERIERVNINFFDITATIIIYVSLLAFIAGYTFSSTEEEGRSGCVLGETFDDGSYYYYDDSVNRWFNGTFGPVPDDFDDAQFDDGFEKDKKEEGEDPSEYAEVFDESIEFIFMTFLFAEITGSIGELNPATALPLIYYGINNSLCEESSKDKAEFYFAVILTPIIIIFYLLDQRHLSFLYGYGKVGIFLFPLTFLTQLIMIYIYPFFATFAFVYMMMKGYGLKRSFSNILVPFERNPAIYYNDMICAQGNHRIVNYLIKKLIRFRVGVNLTAPSSRASLASIGTKVEATNRSSKHSSQEDKKHRKDKDDGDFELSIKDVYDIETSTKRGEKNGGSGGDIQQDNDYIAGGNNEKIQQLHELRLSSQQHMEKSPSSSGTNN